MSGARYLGQNYCDLCDHAGREQVWLLDGGARLCRTHFEERTGAPPPRPLDASDLGPAPAVGPAEAPWTRVIPGLRARPAGTHAVEIQAVRNIRTGEGSETVPVSAATALIVPDVQIVELFLLASAYRDAPEYMKLQVRLQLTRLMHGKETP